MKFWLYGPFGMELAKCVTNYLQQKIQLHELRFKMPVSSLQTRSKICRNRLSWVSSVIRPNHVRLLDISQEGLSLRKTLSFSKMCFFETKVWENIDWQNVHRDGFCVLMMETCLKTNSLRHHGHVLEWCLQTRHIRYFFYLLHNDFSSLSPVVRLSSVALIRAHARARWWITVMPGKNVVYCGQEMYLAQTRLAKQHVYTVLTIY